MGHKHRHVILVLFTSGDFVCPHAVVVVLEDGQAVPRLVETGVRTDTEVQVIRGLEAADRVIVSAIQRLSSGLPVREKGAA